MKKLKVVTIVGTRPELIRLSRVMAALDRHCDHVIVHTGQNYDYELNGIFLEQLGIRKPDHFLEAAGATAAETIGIAIAPRDGVERFQILRKADVALYRAKAEGRNCARLFTGAMDEETFAARYGHLTGQGGPE